MRHEVDDLNRRLARKLREADSIFSEGVTATGDVCVGVGVDTVPLTEERVTAYMQQIRETAQSLNLYHKLMEDMEEIIRRSIHDAEVQLAQERTKKAKGFMSNMWNWWAPSAPETVEGRTFDLARHSAPTASSSSVKIAKSSVSEKVITPNPLEQTDLSRKSFDYLSRESFDSSRPSLERPRVSVDLPLSPPIDLPVGFPVLNEISEKPEDEEEKDENSALSEEDKGDNIDGDSLQSDDEAPPVVQLTADELL